MKTLDADTVAWVESVTGGTVTSSALVTAGGRLGYSVDVDTAEGPLELFAQRDRPGIVTNSSFMGFDREAEVYRAVRSLGVPVPRVWGESVERNVMLVDRVAGSVWFRAPTDPAEAESVAKDFVRHLASWHRTPAKELGLPLLGPVRSVAEHQREVVGRMRAEFEAEDRQKPIDPLGWLMLDILEHHRPDFDGDAVLVQGDTGPGNFLYADGKVTAVIDWELAHIGDPMDDIAWMSWRVTQHGFPDFPQRMREYEQASGHVVDPERVAYYRVNAVARLGPRFGTTDMGGGRSAADAVLASGADAGLDRNADGSQMVLSMLHRRMRLEAIASAIGLDLPPRSVDGEDEPMDHAVYFDLVLGQLQGIVDRVDDRGAAAMAKAAARHVKHLKELDRNGRRYAARERDDIASLLGQQHGSLAESRRALVVAVHEKTVAPEDYLLYHWRRLVHEDHLLRTASGALYERSWPPLHDAPA